MSIFAKAKEKAAATPSSAKKKATTWTVADPALSEAVKELVELEGRAKMIATSQARLKNALLKFAEDQFVQDYVRDEKAPDAPLVVANTDGDHVNFVFQDRGGQYGVTPEQEKDLVELLGKDKVDEILYEETRFSFNRVLMGVPGVMDCLGKHLEACRDELLSTKLLTVEQADSLIDVQTKRTVRHGVFDRLTQICGRDTTRLRDFLRFIGSCAVRYIKA